MDMRICKGPTWFSAVKINFDIVCNFTLIQLLQEYALVQITCKSDGILYFN